MLAGSYVGRGSSWGNPVAPALNPFTNDRQYSVAADMVPVSPIDESAFLTWNGARTAEQMAGGLSVAGYDREPWPLTDSHCSELWERPFAPESFRENGSRLDLILISPDVRPNGISFVIRVGGVVYVRLSSARFDQVT